MEPSNPVALEKKIEHLTRKLQAISAEQVRLEKRIRQIENSVIFRGLRAIGRFFDTRKKKLGQIIRHSPLHPMYLRLLPPKSQNRAYAQWVEQEQAHTPGTGWHREQALQWSFQPCVSIAMPTHNPRREWLEAAVNSVRAQSYSNWQLCICDDASAEPWVEEYLSQQASADARIQYVRSVEPLGISGALNKAGALARGEYVAFLDHDDVLSPVALHYVAEAVQDRQAQVIYSDEDCLDEQGIRTRPSFKPEWSPDLLTACMYWGHLFVVARDRLAQTGPFRSVCDGSQDYDLALRLTDQSDQIRHIPRILYHWRQHPLSTAVHASAKPYTHAAGRRALEDAVGRRHWQATVLDGAMPNTYYVQRRIMGSPLASIVICSRNSKLLRRCLQSAFNRTAYANREVVVVEHQEGDSAEIRTVSEQYGCVRVPFAGTFNFAGMNNRGARAAKGKVLVFLNDDVVPLVNDWLDHMLAHAQRTEVGAVGAKLLYGSGAIQHAGLTLGMMDGIGHPGRGMFRSDWLWLDLTRNVSAVTGACLGTRREVFEELGGLDPLFPVNYNDVDLCLRARKAGYAIVYEPHAVLRHDECQSRTGGTRHEERELFYERWHAMLEKPDPYYPAALDHTQEEIRLGSWCGLR